MKKITALLLAFVFLLGTVGMLAGCSDPDTDNKPKNEVSLYYFETNEDGTSCSIKGINRYQLEDAEIVLPSQSPEGLPVTGILESAFECDELLTGITIPEGVTTIGDRAFYECTALKTVNLPDSLTVIGNSAFYSCAALETINMPAGLTKIGASGFKGCSSIQSVSFPEGFEELGDAAFEACTSLKSVSFPKSAAYISNAALWYCSALETITVAEGNPVYHSSGNCLINTEEKTLYKATNNSVIPDDGSVTVILSGAFACLSTMTEITIPEGIVEICSGAFDECTALKTVVIPASAEKISGFFGCTALTSIMIPDGVKEIGSLAFGECTALTSVVISGKVEKIGSDPFYGCTELNRVNFLGNKSLWYGIYEDDEWDFTVDCLDGMI